MKIFYCNYSQLLLIKVYINVVTLTNSGLWRSTKLTTHSSTVSRPRPGQRTANQMYGGVPSGETRLSLLLSLNFFLLRSNWKTAVKLGTTESAGRITDCTDVLSFLLMWLCARVCSNERLSNLQQFHRHSRPLQAVPQSSRRGRRGHRTPLSSGGRRRWRRSSLWMEE